MLLTVVAGLLGLIVAIMIFGGLYLAVNTFSKEQYTNLCKANAVRRKSEMMMHEELQTAGFLTRAFFRMKLSRGEYERLRLARW